MTIISHPGEILKEEFLDEMDISVYALSKAISVPRSRMNDVVMAEAELDMSSIKTVDEIRA